MTAISNTLIDSIETISQGDLYHFQTTPYMSTYLLVWIIGRFDYLESFSKLGIRIRIYTPIGIIWNVKCILEIAKESIDFLIEYFGIPYPLPKLDIVGIHRK